MWWECFLVWDWIHPSLGQEHFGGEKEPREGQPEWEVVNKATRLVLDQQAGEEKDSAMELGEDKLTSL